jgi:energy-coupling factor transporter ATP-binding protein EcfA2
LDIPSPEQDQRGELVIFERPNGSGKTTIAHVIACAAELPSDIQRDVSALRPPLDEVKRRLHSNGTGCVARIEHGSARLDVHGPSPRRQWLPRDGTDTNAGKLITESARAANA